MFDCSLPAVYAASFTSLRFRSTFHSYLIPLRSFRSIRSFSCTNLGNPRKSSSFSAFRSFPTLRSIEQQLWYFSSICLLHSENAVAQFHPGQITPFRSVTTLAFPRPVQRYALRKVHPGKVIIGIYIYVKKVKKKVNVGGLPTSPSIVVSRSSPTGFAIFFYLFTIYL